MTTIEDVKNIIKNFELNLSEIAKHLNEQDNYIDKVSFNTERVGTALQLLKFMTRNKVKVLNTSFFSFELDDPILSMDYSDIITDKIYKISQHNNYTIIVLDKESPYYMSKIMVNAYYLKGKYVQFVFSNIDGEIYTDNMIKNRDGKYCSYKKAITNFIKESITVKKQLEAIRKSVDIRNNPIGR